MTGATASRSTRSTAHPGTSSRSSGGASSPPICASASISTASGAPSSCARISSPPRRSRWRTTSPPRWWYRRGRSSGCRATAREAGHSLKLARNCEYRLFQRPDDAIIPGFDKQTELDMAQDGNFIANFEPLDGTRRWTRSSDDVLTLSTFTAPMRERLRAGGARRPCRRLLRPPAAGRRQADEESALPAGPPGSGQPGAQLRRRDGRAPPPQAAAGHPGLPPGRRGADRTAQQPAGARHPGAGGLQPDPLPGTARAVHGLHLLAHRQVAVHHRGRQRRGADQGAVQRPAPDRGSQQRSGLLHPHRLCRVLQLGRTHRPGREGRRTTCPC